jgi:general secretion pathway protein D
LGSSRSGTGGFGSSGFRTGGTTAAATGTRGTMRLSTATAAAASDLVGQAYVVADEDTNSLLVTTASKNFERIKAILTDLDRPVPQVLIKVLIAEVTHDKTLDLGTEFSILNLRAAGDGTKLSTDFSVAAQTGGIIYKVIDVGDYTAIFRALAGVGKLDVLSRPYILTSDNQEASIMVGQEVPFVTRSQLTEAGQTINTIEYDDIGIILTVTPHINPDGLVIMDVYPEISALTGTTVAISETVRAPVFARRAAQSRVAIRDGQTIVIGGLMEDRNTDNVQKVPLLGDIPGLGILFSRTIREKVKTELLIFLTPHVAKVPDDLEAMSEDEQAGTKVIPKAVEKGAFEEHMRGMQRGAAPHPPAEAERESPPATSQGGPPPAGAP